MRYYSRPIMVYLVSKYARNDSLYPRDPKQKAMVDQMMYFDAGSLYPNIAKCYVCVAFLFTELFQCYYFYSEILLQCRISDSVIAMIIYSGVDLFFMLMLVQYFSITWQHYIHISLH